LYFQQARILSGLCFNWISRVSGREKAGERRPIKIRDTLNLHWVDWTSKRLVGKKYLR
jgi:hypothetical protein